MAAIRAAQVGCRSAGSFASAVRITSSTAAGSAALRALALGGSCSRCAQATASRESLPERRLAGQALVQQAAERVHVRAAVDRLAFDLLGGDVRRRAERAPVQQRATLVDEAAREAEVGEVDVLAGVEQDVRRLHVAVHEAARVRRVERARDLRADRAAPAPGRAAPSLRSSARRSRALDVAHRQVQPAVGLAGVVDRDDVRVLERRCELGLAQEALAEALVQGELRAR